MDIARPVCFVLMPFGTQHDHANNEAVDFNQIYSILIQPAVESAGLIPFRADDEFRGGIFHQPMFERLTMCEVAIADLSMANANVYYELGIRHGCRPWSTILIHQADRPLPLDVALDASLEYDRQALHDSNAIQLFRRRLTRRLVEAEKRSIDSPVFQLVAGMPLPVVDHLRVEAMFEEIGKRTQTVADIHAAARSGVTAVRSLHARAQRMGELTSEFRLGLMVAYRGVEAWQDMIATINDMDPTFASSVVVQEQLGLALGRTGDFERSRLILEALVAQRPSSETFGLLGGVIKRQWQQAVESRVRSAPALLRQAENAYTRGFESDWRDPYPGINAVTLKSVLLGRPATTDDFFSVVRYSARRRVAAQSTDYWDHAGLMELELLSGEHANALEQLEEMLARPINSFCLTTTRTNLKIVRQLCTASEELSVLWQELASGVEDALRTRRSDPLPVRPPESMDR